MFRKSFQNSCYNLFSQFQQNFLLHFHNYFNSSHNFPKMFCKHSFLFLLSSTTTFLYFTKIRRHYFYKTYKIFKQYDGVLRTFSKSSWKFLLKLASHYKKLQNMSRVFHQRWKTIDSRFLSMGGCETSDLFLICLRTIAELGL